MHCAWNSSRTLSAPRRFHTELAGFTFAEVLAAMVFLSVLIPVVIEGLLVAQRAASAAERKTVAADLAAAKLNELIVTGTWQSINQGDFGPDWPAYTWRLESGSWSVDDLTELSLVVSFEVAGREREIRLTTLVDSTTTSSSP